MAKNNRRLSRENVQDFLSKSEPDTGGSDSGDKSPKREPKKSSFRGTIAVGATIAGRLTRGANTLGGTLADSIRAEVTHSDFGVRLKAFGIGMAVAAALLAVWMLVPWFQRWDTIPYDLKMRTRFTNAPESGSIVHMDLDDQTFASVGRWPWSREKWAGFVGAANEAGVRHLVFDVEYSQPQQEEVDRNAFRRFREWGEHELPSRIGGVQSFVAEAVALAEKNISATAEQLANASTVEEAKQLRNEIARQVLELKRIREQLRDNPLDRELVDAFIEQASDVVMDYDDQFAAAVLEAGNVVIPHRFDRSALTQAQVGRPIVTKELFEAIERHFDTVGAENLGRVSRDDVPAGIIGMQIRDEVAGETVTDDEQLARKYADETYTNVRMLYLYRLVRRWYASQPAEQVWSDMASFLSSRTEFSESCFVPGQVFGRLSDAFQATGFQHDWVRQALEQLHRYYSWVQLTEGKQDKSRRPAWLAGLPKESVIGHDAPVALPIDVIQGYKMEEWDPWEPRVDSHDGGSGLFHYRDTGFSPAIFRLFNASCSTGFVSIEHDYDGTVRRTPLFVICEDTFHGKRYVVPQMAFMTAMMEVAADRSSIKIVPGQYVEFRAIRDLVEALRKDVPLPSADWNRIVAGVKEADYETYRIKVDKRCMVKINWAGGDNTPFFELFGHIPVSRIIDIAEAGRELERNRQQLARGLADPRNRLDKLTYQTGKRTALFEHYNMPAMQTTRWLGSNAEGWPERLKLSISDLHADLVLKHHRDRVAELQANSAAWEAAYAMEDGEAKAATLEKLENALATRDAERLGQTLSSFRQELHRLLGWPEAVAPEDLPGLLDASGLTEAASAKVAESLGKLDGAPVTDTKALGELASALAGDVDAPHLKFMHTRLNTSKRLTSPQKAKLMLFVLQAKSGLLSEGPLFSDSMEQIDQLCVTATGHKPADIPTEREWAMERQLFQDYDVGRLRDNGTALRKLLFDLEHPIKTEDLTAAKANPSGPQAVRVLKRLGWEIPLLKQADMLAAEDPALTIVSAEGFDPENVEENLRTALLAFEPSDTGIVIRRRNSLFATVASVEARFSQDRQTKLEAARKLVGDRFALVGWASTGSGDLIVTPNSRSIPGPALHSNMFNTVLHGIEPIPAHGLTVVIAVLCGLLVSFSTARLPVKWAIGATVLTFVAAWFVDSYFFSSKAWSIQTLSIMAPVAFGFLSIQGYRPNSRSRASLASSCQQRR